jgi:hypothetical protein
MDFIWAVLMVLVITIAGIFFKEITGGVISKIIKKK